MMMMLMVMMMVMMMVTVILMMMLMLMPMPMLMLMPMQMQMQMPMPMPMPGQARTSNGASSAHWTANVVHPRTSASSSPANPPGTAAFNAATTAFVQTLALQQTLGAATQCSHASFRRTHGADRPAKLRKAAVSSSSAHSTPPALRFARPHLHFGAGGVFFDDPLGFGSQMRRGRAYD